jgi:hypothetical protein
MNSNASAACFYSITESSWSKAGRNSDLKAIHQKWTIFPREDISFRLKVEARRERLLHRMHRNI